MRLAQIVLIITITVITFLIWAEHQIKVIH